MAQGTYVVSTQPVQARTYPNKHGGNLTVWRLGLQGVASTAPDGLFELHKKEGNDPPAVGEQLEVERTQEGEFQGETFGRIFLAYKQDGAPQGGGYSGGGKSPDQQRSIVRQHSQEMALRFIAATGDIKDMNLSDPTVVGAYLSGTVKRLTDWFAQDAGSAPAQPAAQPQLNGGQQEVPADTAGLTPAPVGASDDVPFRTLPVPDFETRRRDLFV